MRNRNFDKQRVEWLITELLKAIGEDPTREGLVDTPKRTAAWWHEFLHPNNEKLGTSFESDTTDGESVVVSNMRVWGICEHHLIPFYCDISIGYYPNQKVLGLSKFARIAKYHAGNISLQEKLIKDIKATIIEKTGTNDVIVLGQGEHLCMTMRGVKTPHKMTTLCFDGVYNELEKRKEFLAQVNLSKSVSTL